MNGRNKVPLPSWRGIPLLKASIDLRGGSQDVTEFVRRLVKGAKGQGITEQSMRDEVGDLAKYVVAKFKAARDRKREATDKCEGRKSYAEAKPEMVGMAQQLSGQRPRFSLRQISAQLAEAGYQTPRGLPCFRCRFDARAIKEAGHYPYLPPKYSNLILAVACFGERPISI
jgi:hypothetical protein